MQPEMTPHEIANEIRVRQIQSRIYGEGETFVMVEGKTDEVLWEEFRAEQDCTLYPAQGKANIIAALRVICQRGFQGIAGIIDLDYTLLCDSYERDLPNLLYDDCCPDMELILLRSPALKKVLRHTFDDIETGDVHDFADEVQTASLRLAAEFGYFRLLSHIKDFGLRCNAIPLREVIDLDTLELDRELVASRLAVNDAGQGSEELLLQVEELRQQYPSCCIQLCRGKDVLAIMAFILPRMYEARFGGKLPASANQLTGARQLAKELRKAYDSMYFKETSLFGCIRDWERANQPYTILKPAI